MAQPTKSRSRRTKRLALIAVAVFNVLAIGGVAYSVVSLGGSSSAKPAPDRAEEEPDEESADPEGEEAKSDGSEKNENGAGEGEAQGDGEAERGDGEQAGAPTTGSAKNEGRDPSESASGDGRAEPGLVVPLDPFVVNLADPETPHYLKLDLALEVADSKGKSEIDKSAARVRDTVLAYLSGLSMEQTMGPLGKSDMRFAIKTRVNQVLPSQPVVRVYFTQFIVH